MIALTTYERKRMSTITDAVPPTADSILDVGCARHDRASRARGNLHAELHRQFPGATIVGVDADRAAVDRMDSPGYDIRHADAETMDLDESFDVIVAGDVIEHLSNPGAFLERASAHLNPGGCVVVSTPNPDCHRYWLRAAAGNHTSPSHTCWIGAEQLRTLANRAGLALWRVEWVVRETLGARALDWLGKRRIAANGYVGVLS